MSAFCSLPLQILGDPGELLSAVCALWSRGAIRRGGDAGNIKKHGISLSRAIDFEMLVFLEDDRFDYGETRYRAWGLIDGEAYCLAFTDRGGVIRAISLRRAHQKEMDRYVPKA